MNFDEECERSIKERNEARIKKSCKGGPQQWQKSILQNEGL
jgi:hypothetical protein